MEKGKRLLEKLNFATFAVTLGRLHSRMIQRVSLVLLHSLPNKKFPFPSVLYAVYAAVHKWAHCMERKTVDFQSNNTIVVAYIRNQGGTKSLPLLKMTRKLLLLAKERKISIQPQGD
nr:unnamed protein product [Callosobruchus chinensis]